jgi:hypothetical protein
MPSAGFEPSGSRPKPYTARPPGSASEDLTALSVTEISGQHLPHYMVQHRKRQPSLYSLT